MPRDPREPYDAREIVARLVDGSEFDEFKRCYGPTLVTGFARIWGYPVGIVANNGILFGERARKGAHFVELCAQRGIPLVFLQNITGFMVGRKYEAGGIARDGAKMVTAVATAAVPKFTVVVGGSLRGRQLRHVRPGLFAPLPVDVAQRPHLRHGRHPGRQRAGPAAPRQHRGPRRHLAGRGRGRLPAPIEAQYERQGHPYYASARLWDDGIIAPEDTRMTLALALSAALNAPPEPTRFGLFRM